MLYDRVGRLAFEQLTRANIPRPRIKIWAVAPLQVCQIKNVTNGCSDEVIRASYT